MDDYNINLDEYNNQPDEPKSFSSNDYQKQKLQAEKNAQINEEQQNKNSIEHMDNSQAPTGVTKLCQLQFYEQFFRVSQLDVTERVRLSFMPMQNNFMESLGGNPDFYGPFWVLTTIIFLVSSTGNLSRYFYNWSKDEYIFKLELVRYGVMTVYSFGLGVPVLFYSLIKFMGGKKISLPELICIYGYSFSCFIPIFILCIVPSQAIQWLLMAYGTINTTAFLVLNLKSYVEDMEKPKYYTVLGLIVAIQLALFLTFKLVFFKMVYENVPA